MCRRSAGGPASHVNRPITLTTDVVSGPAAAPSLVRGPSKAFRLAIGIDNTCCRVPPDALRRARAAALVPLPRGLSRDTELCGYFWPADAEVDGTIDECIELCLRPVSRRSDALEPLQHLRHRP